MQRQCHFSPWNPKRLINSPKTPTHPSPIDHNNLCYYLLLLTIHYNADNLHCHQDFLLDSLRTKLYVISPKHLCRSLYIFSLPGWIANETVNVTVTFGIVHAKFYHNNIMQSSLHNLEDDNGRMVYLVPPARPPSKEKKNLVYSFLNLCTFFTVKITIISKRLHFPP